MKSRPITYTLRATFSDDHSVDLPGEYHAKFAAERAARNYINDYSDPCGLGVHVVYVSAIKKELA